MYHDKIRLQNLKTQEQSLAQDNLIMVLLSNFSSVSSLVPLPPAASFCHSKN
jgi:hypothetical protein